MRLTLYLRLARFNALNFQTKTGGDSSALTDFIISSKMLQSIRLAALQLVSCFFEKAYFNWLPIRWKFNENSISKMAFTYPMAIYLNPLNR